MKQYTQNTLENYAEIVRLIDKHTPNHEDGLFRWTLSIANSKFDAEVILSTLKDEDVIYVQDVAKTSKAISTVSYDTIKVIMGYAYSNQVKLEYRAYLNVEV